MTSIFIFSQNKAERVSRKGRPEKESGQENVTKINQG